MQIGEPLRTIVVEPLELPVNGPQQRPELEPIAPIPDPEGDPATSDRRSRLHLADHQLPRLAVGRCRIAVTQWRVMAAWQAARSQMPGVRVHTVEEPSRRNA